MSFVVLTIVQNTPPSQVFEQEKQIFINFLMHIKKTLQGWYDTK
jgi:hypothetical protein